MTKKDYIKIAEILRNAKPVQGDVHGYDGFAQAKVLWDKIVLNTSEMFKKDNGLFNIGKFLNAVGMD